MRNIKGLQKMYEGYYVTTGKTMFNKIAIALDDYKHLPELDEGNYKVSPRNFSYNKNTHTKYHLMVQQNPTEKEIRNNDYSNFIDYDVLENGKPIILYEVE